MGRGIARKAAFTGKCHCENPQWHADDIEVNGRTKEITYKLICRNCWAFWGSKSNSCREYWKDKMDKKPVVWLGYGYNGSKTTKQLFHDLDIERLEILQSEFNHAKKIAEKAKEEAEKANNKLKKFEEQIKMFEDSIC